MKHPNRFQVLVALDQLVNTLFGGMADESVSSRCHRRRLRGKPCLANAIDKLFWWQEEHCKTAYESEIARQHLPLNMRE